MPSDFDVQLSFVRTEMVVPPAEGVSQPPQLYYFFNLAQMTRRTLGLLPPAWTLQPHQLRAFESQMDNLLTELPWPVFANWMRYRGTVAWEQLGDRRMEPQNAAALRESQAPGVHRVLAWFVKEPLNERYSKYLLPPSDSSPWWNVPTHIPDGEEFAGEEIILGVEAETEELEPFTRYYDRTLHAAKQSLIDEEVADLRATLGKDIRTLESLISRNDEEIATPMGQVLQKLQTGERMFDMVTDFARPASWREDNWGSRWAGLDYVVPTPGAGQRKRLSDWRHVWRTDLLRPCAQVIIESRGEGPIDDAALRIVGRLRDDNGACLTMLRNWDTLYAASRTELVQTIRRAFALAVRGKRALAQLLRGEFAELAIAAGVRGTAVGPRTLSPLDTRARDELLHNAVEQLDVAAMFHKTEQTPLGQYLAGKMKSATGMLTNGAVALDVLALATPYIVKTISVSDSSGASATAWLWRTAVGCGEFSNKGQTQFWNRVQNLVWKQEIPLGKTAPVRIITKGGLSRAVESHGAILKAVNLAATMIVLLEGAERHKQDDFATGLKEFSGLMGLMKETADLVATPSLRKLLGTTAEEAELLTKEMSVTKVVPFLGIAADALALAVSIQEARTSKTWSKMKRESLVDNALLDGLALALSVATLVVGAEFLVVGALIYATKELLQNPDTWAHVLPGIGKKPHTHLYLQGLLRALTQEKDPSDPEGERDNPLRVVIENLTSDTGRAFKQNLIDHLGQYEAPPVADDPVLWEVGGKGGKHFTNRARTIAYAHYDFPREVCKDLVWPS